MANAKRQITQIPGQCLYRAIMSWKYLGQTQPKARKEHLCGLCAEAISKGEKHFNRVGIADGELSSFRMHTRCEKLTQDWDFEDWETHDPVAFREGMEEEKKKENRFCVEYEIPPLRGIMQKHFLDDGQDIKDVRAAFLFSAPTARIRAITKITAEVEG